MWSSILHHSTDYSSLAQLVEQESFKLKVAGSIPAGGTSSNGLLLITNVISSAHRNVPYPVTVCAKKDAFR